MKKRKGFTLVELLVVIAILAILATASIVGYTAFTGRAKESNLKSELSQLRTVLVAEDENNDAFAIGEEAFTLDTTYYHKLNKDIFNNADLASNHKVASANDYVAKNNYDLWTNGDYFYDHDGNNETAPIAVDAAAFTAVETEAGTWQAILALNSDLEGYVEGEEKELELYPSKKAVALVDNKEHIVVVWAVGEQEISVVNWDAYQSMFA